MWLLINLFTSFKFGFAYLTILIAGIPFRRAGRVFFASQLGGVAQLGDACAGLDRRFAVEAVGVAGVALRGAGGGFLVANFGVFMPGRVLVAVFIIAAAAAALPGRVPLRRAGRGGHRAFVIVAEGFCLFVPMLAAGFAGVGDRPGGLAGRLFRGLFFPVVGVRGGAGRVGVVVFVRIAAGRAGVQGIAALVFGGLYDLRFIMVLARRDDGFVVRIAAGRAGVGFDAVRVAGRFLCDLRACLMGFLLCLAAAGAGRLMLPAA